MYARRKGKGGTKRWQLYYFRGQPHLVHVAICRYLATDYNKPETPIQKVQSMFETSGWKLGCPSINHNWRIRRRQNPLLVDGKEQVVYKWSWSTAIPGASAMAYRSPATHIRRALLEVLRWDGKSQKLHAIEDCPTLT